MVGLSDILNRVYLWVYCLPLAWLILLGAVATVGFCILLRRFARCRWWRPVLYLMFCGWFAVVLWATLLQRGASELFEVRWIPFSSYLEIFSGNNPETFRTVLMNVALFYPAGLLLGSLISRRRLCLLLLLGLFSLTIELSQFWFQLGFCEIDDVLHNTLSAALGFAAFRLFEKYTGE